MPSPVRRTLLLVCLGVLAACGGDRLVATVDGVAISQSTIETLAGEEGGSSIDASRFAAMLTAAIIDQVLVTNAASEHGLQASQQEMNEQKEEFAKSLAASQIRLDDYIKQQGWSESFFELLTRRQTIGVELGKVLDQKAGPVSDADVQTKLAEYTDRTIVCASHILVATEEEAKAVKVRLDQGEDFATVAMEISIDTGSGASGGDLGCASPDGYVPGFAEASKKATSGVVTDPAKSEFGFHLILVEDPTPEEVRTELEETRPVTLFLDWETAVIKAAKVSVEERFGTWTTDPEPNVIPPG